ncbi:hypothetical protein [Paractinoplanes atraurantiacus]|nr:hypothetical protein [Actinoplanes atraurantiacus]
MLFTVAGSSCSGKTTAARALAGIDGLLVHDFDEIGVPRGADKVWRQRATEEWVRRVLQWQQEGLDVILTGQSPLGEVLACPSATEVDGIAACLVDVDDAVRWQRLEDRDPGKWSEDAKRAFIRWARWMRGHAADPRHMPEAITRGGHGTMRWERWRGWARGDRRWVVRVVDTTGRTAGQTAADLTRWVAEARADKAAGRLALSGRWAR